MLLISRGPPPTHPIPGENRERGLLFPWLGAGEGGGGEVGVLFRSSSPLLGRLRFVLTPCFSPIVRFFFGPVMNPFLEASLFSCVCLSKSNLRACRHGGPAGLSMI